MLISIAAEAAWELGKRSERHACEGKKRLEITGFSGLSLVAKNAIIDTN